MKNPSDPSGESPATVSRRRIGAGPLAVSLAAHGIVIALGTVWILRTLPPPAEKVLPPISAGSHGPAKPSIPSRKQQQAAAGAGSLSRISAIGVSSPISLPAPQSAGEFSSLAGPGGSAGHPTLAGGFTSGTPELAKAGGGEGFLFQLPQPAQRVAYVLDFSMTMVGEKDSLMRRELEKALEALPSTTSYSVICFSGPVWLPGDKVEGNTVESGGKTYEWTSKSLWEWKSSTPAIRAPWTTATEAEVKRTLRLVKDVSSSGGTDWEGPLDVAISMEPPPQQVFFMTDGVMEQRDMMRLTRSISAKAKARGVTVNTVSLMEPGAEEPMADLAKRTGGAFTIVNRDGTIHRRKAE